MQQPKSLSRPRSDVGVSIPSLSSLKRSPCHVSLCSAFSEICDSHILRLSNITLCHILQRYLCLRFFLTSWRLCHGCFTRHRYEGPQRITPTTRGYSLQRKTKSRKVPGAKSELFHAVETRIMCVSKLDWRIIRMFKIANAIVTVLELNYNHTDTPWWILLIV